MHHILSPLRIARLLVVLLIGKMLVSVVLNYRAVNGTEPGFGRSAHNSTDAPAMVH